MLLIVDANVAFAALIVKGKTFELFVWNELNNRLEFVAPEYLSMEIENNLEEVLRRSKLSKAEFEEVNNGRIADRFYSRRRIYGILYIRLRKFLQQMIFRM